MLTTITLVTSIGLAYAGSRQCNLAVQGPSTVQGNYQPNGISGSLCSDGTTVCYSISSYNGPSNLKLRQLTDYGINFSNNPPIKNGWYIFTDSGSNQFAEYPSSAALMNTTTVKILAKCTSPLCVQATTAADIPTSEISNWQVTSDGGKTWKSSVISTGCCPTNPPKCDPAKWSATCKSYTSFWGCSWESLVTQCCTVAGFIDMGECIVSSTNSQATCQTFTAKTPTAALQGVAANADTTGTLVDITTGGDGEVSPFYGIIVGLICGIAILGVVVIVLAIQIVRIKKANNNSNNGQTRNGELNLSKL